MTKATTIIMKNTKAKDKDGYYHFELNVLVSTKEEGFTLDKMFILISNALRGENEERCVCAGPPKNEKNAIRR